MAAHRSSEHGQRPAPYNIVSGPRRLTGTGTVSSTFIQTTKLTLINLCMAHRGKPKPLKLFYGDPGQKLWGMCRPTFYKNGCRGIVFVWISPSTLNLKSCLSCELLPCACKTLCTTPFKSFRKEGKVVRHSWAVAGSVAKSFATL